MYNGESFIDVLNSEWNGLERGSDSWCQEQVRLLTNRILESADVDGIRAIIAEMAKNNLIEASSYAAMVIEHLFKLKFSTSGEDSLFSGWKREVVDRQNDLAGVFFKGANKDVLTTYRDEFIDRYWSLALKFYKKDTSDYPDLISGLRKIPKVCPYTPEDLMDLSVTELLDKLVEK